jgi:alpha-L-glutamate ligase-like protein/uncharacterized protein (TIGR02421 family)
MPGAKSILGMNARNLSYILKGNSRHALRIANNKLLTKKVLLKANIPTPALFATISRTREVEEFNWELLPQSFVVKPNLGLGGEGILVIKNRVRNEETGEYEWVSIGGERFTADHLRTHVLNILDGHFSMSNDPDIAFFEERLIVHQSLRNISYRGVPDIRVIVYNHVPVMAMMRLPTKKSDGKANLAQGGVGVGIDLATGITTHSLVKKPRRHFLDNHPDTGAELRDFQIPFWDEILEMAIQTQKASGLGYLGADVVLDQHLGPVIIEINGHSGLEIQLVNRAGLAERLSRVKGLNIDSAKKGISVAKELFGGEIERRIEDISGKHVIGLVEPAKIKIGKNKLFRVLAKIDMSTGLTMIREKLLQEFPVEDIEPRLSEKKGRRSLKIDFYLDEQKITTLARVVPDDQIPYSLVVGRRDLQSFFIDPSKKKTVIGTTDIDRIKQLDRRLYHISNQVGVLSFLKPANYEEEREAFFASDTYNPVFEYAPIPLDFRTLRKNLTLLRFDDSPIGQLLEKKRKEDVVKVSLLEHIGRESFSAHAVSLYGQPGESLIQDAWAHYRREPSAAQQQKRVFLKQKTILSLIDEHIAHYGFRYRVVVQKGLHARMLVKGQIPTIYLRKGAKFTKEDLLGTLAHEIDTHVLRRQNGERQPYKLFLSGTAGLISTEEGLGVYNNERIYDNPRTFDTSCLFVIATQAALKGSLRDTYRALLDIGVSETSAWNIAFKVKRGFGDTAQPGAFTRYHLYLKGKRHIEQFVEQGGDLRKLYIGKIHTRDLPLVAQIKDLKEPKFLPEWLS